MKILENNSLFFNFLASQKKKKSFERNQIELTVLITLSTLGKTLVDILGAKYFSTVVLYFAYRTVLMTELSVLYCSTLSLWHCAES
jgi:hypothetical protein